MNKIQQSKQAVLWIGGDVQCSIINGMSWHLHTPGKNLFELLEEKYHLIKGRPEDWELKSNALFLKNKQIASDFLSNNVIGVFIYHKNVPETTLKRLQSIYDFFCQNHPSIQLVNSPHQSKLFSSKLSFLKHTSALPNAKTIIPGWHIFETEDDLDKAIHEFGFPMLIKPDSLSGGKGIIKVSNKKHALKLLEKSKKGYYHLDMWSIIKKYSKNPINNFIIADKKPIKLLVNDFVDTYHPEYKCNINATIYFWMGELTFADVRASNQGFNIHAGNTNNSKLPEDHFLDICNRTMKLIKENLMKIKELVASLHQHSMKLDCLIDLNHNDLKIAEVEIKNGLGYLCQDKILSSMNNVGWDVSRVRKYLNGKSCDAEDIFNDNIN